ncbi:MAG: orotate phosphoribosyltransferase [Fusobacteria bacterium]|nr:MAG: orotate phosphoribosyltransferase [Fusobacteriota bacterium]
MNNSKKVARALLKVEAVRLNVSEPFTFVSGIKSPIYCDNRKVIGFPKERTDIVNAFMEALEGKDYDLIAGTSTAGIPWAAFIADRLNVPMAYIRSKPKAHGAGKQIEGGDVEGKKVIVIEDLISTGGSCISAIEACRREGAKEVEVLAIFSYEFQKAYDRFEEINCKWETLSKFSDLIILAKEENYLSEEDAKEASQWNKSPNTWKK